MQIMFQEIKIHPRKKIQKIMIQDQLRDMVEVTVLRREVMEVDMDLKEEVTEVDMEPKKEVTEVAVMVPKRVAMVVMDPREEVAVVDLADQVEELLQRERAVTITIMVQVVTVMLKFLFPLLGLHQKFRSKEETPRSKLNCPVK